MRQALIGGAIVVAVVLFAALQVVGTGGDDGRLPPADPARSVGAADPGRGDRSVPMTGEAPGDVRAIHGDRGAGPRVTVVVDANRGRGKATAPTEGVRVLVGLGHSGGPYAPALAETLLDAEGLGQVAIPWAAIDAVRDHEEPRLWSMAQAPGVLPKRAAALLPATSDEVKAMKVYVEAGVRLEGRLVDVDGRPVAGRVVAVRIQEDGSRQQTDRATVRGDGAFALDLDKRGTHRVLAEGTSDPEGLRGFSSHGGNVDLGTGISESLDIDFASTPEPMVITVSGPGVLRGRVTSAGGEPASGLFLSVTPVDLDGLTGGDLWAASQARQLEGRGVAQASRQADVDGRFEFRGLRDEPYLVRARLIGEFEDEFPTLLTPGGVPPNGSFLELRFARPHLVVSLVGMDGRPFEGDVEVLRSRRYAMPDEWPDTLMLAVTVPVDATAGLRSEPVVPGRALGGGAFVYEPSGVESVLVGVMGSGVPYHPALVTLTGADGGDHHELVVPDPVPSGRIVLHGEDAEGGPLDDSIRIRLFDPATGEPLVDADGTAWFSREWEWPVEFEVPAGRYRLRVDDAPSIETQHGTLRAAREFGAFEQDVTVIPGGTHEVSFRLDHGARIRLALEGDVLEADAEAVRAQTPGAHDGYVDYWAQRADVMLVQAGRRAIGVHFRDTEMFRGTSAAGTHLIPLLPLGEEAVSEALPAGTYRLEARMPGGRVAARDVVLQPGVTLDVRLRFD